MNNSEIKNIVFEALKLELGENEAGSIARIYSEDKEFPEDSTIEIKSEIIYKDVQKLLDNFPVQYLVGKAYFYDSYFKVNQYTLIPRPETEELVYWIIQNCKKGSLKVLDIGTGSGCIAIVLKKYLPNIEVTALDVSNKALRMATENAEDHQVEIEFVNIDFLNEEATEELGNFDVIVSNPPYVAVDEINMVDNSALRYEPGLALFPLSKDPLIFYRSIQDFSMKFLNPSGQIFLEVNEFHAKETMAIFETNGFYGHEIKKDLQGKDRMIRILKKSV